MVANTEQPEDLPLSPSEKISYNAANKLAGSSRRSTKRSLAAVLLACELVVLFLAALTLYGLKMLNPPELGLLVGAVLCSMCVLALALLRFRVGMLLGWLTQAALIAVTYGNLPTLLVALLFVGVWIYFLDKGAKIDAARAQQEH